MKQATLCFLLKEGYGNKEILLAMKKKGFGVGKWNGIGGKFDPEKGDKNLVDTAIRETEEEIGAKIKNPEKVAILSFYYPYISNEEWDQDVHVFLATDWEGKLIESEEMLPKWFKIEELPFGEMWDDDKFWLPLILEGKKFKARFLFKEEEKVLEKDFNFLQGID